MSALYLVGSFELDVPLHVVDGTVGLLSPDHCADRVVGLKLDEGVVPALGPVELVDDGHGGAGHVRHGRLVVQAKEGLLVEEDLEGHVGLAGRRHSDDNLRQRPVDVWAQGSVDTGVVHIVDLYSSSRIYFLDTSQMKNWVTDEQL